MYVGKISYSCYLWHWPVLALAKYQLSRSLTPAETAVALSAAFALAVISWRYIETPIRENKRIFSQRVLFAMSATAMAIVAIAGTVGMLTGGLPSRYPNFVSETVSGKKRYNPAPPQIPINPAAITITASARISPPWIFARHLFLAGALSQQLDVFLPSPSRLFKQCSFRDIEKNCYVKWWRAPPLPQATRKYPQASAA